MREREKEREREVKGETGNASVIQYLNAEGCHQHHNISQAAMLPAQCQHLGIAWGHGQLGHGAAQGSDGKGGREGTQLLQ